MAAEFLYVTTVGSDRTKTLVDQLDFAVNASMFSLMDGVLMAAEADGSALVIDPEHMALLSANTSQE